MRAQKSDPSLGSYRRQILRTMAVTVDLLLRLKREEYFVRHEEDD